MGLQKFRDSGAIGALLDEYERAILELQKVIHSVSPKELTTIIDSKTSDEDCRSIQTILTHVLGAGYYYAVETRRYLGDEANFITIKPLNSTEEFKTALNKMFQFNVKLVEDYPTLQLLENDNDKKMTTRWKQSYDIEQLYEHAIVHILRHRRQIEQFLLKLRPTPTNTNE